jgi:hypothetical protein
MEDFGFGIADFGFRKSQRSEVRRRKSEDKDDGALEEWGMKYREVN